MWALITRKILRSMDAQCNTMITRGISKTLVKEIIRSVLSYLLPLYMQKNCVIAGCSGEKTFLQHD